jgi:peptidoglycan/LPS O-acetylase OafA/YrhL
MGGGALILTPRLHRFLHIPDLVRFAGFDSMQAMGFSLLLLQSIFYPQSGFYRFLNWKWVAHIGILSYSIYIWQQMFCAPGEPVLGVQGAWYVSFPGCILAALLAAHASYYLLEKPLLALRARFRET